MEVFWLQRRMEDVLPGGEWLAAGEAAICDSLRIPKRRADWRLGRWTAKQAIATLLDLPSDVADLAAIEIVALPNGAPHAVVQGEAAPLTISLSHSNGESVCAVARGQIGLGCDLERIEPRSDAFVADYFTDGERQLIAKSGAADRDLLLNILWSAKESSLKALQEGLRLDTRSVSVERVDWPQFCCPWSALMVRAGAGRIFDGWWRADARFVYTLVASPAPRPPIELHSERSLPAVSYV